MRLIVLIVCLLGALSGVFAQDVIVKKFKPGVGISLAIPASNLTTNTLGAGIDLFGEYGISNTLALTADAGYTALFAKYDLPVTGVIPFRIGARYFPVSKLYVAAKGGLGLYTLATTSISYTAYSLGAGYILNKAFDASATYDGFVNNNSSFGYMAIRLGYRFK